MDENDDADDELARTHTHTQIANPMNCGDSVECIAKYVK